MKGKSIYSCEDKIYAIFLHDPSRVVLLMRLCSMPNHGPFRALLDGGGNLLDGDLLSGGRLPLVTYFHPLPPNYETCWPISVPTYSQGQVSVADVSSLSSTGIAA